VKKINVLQKMVCLACLSGGLVGDAVAGEAKAEGGVLARRVADGLFGCLETAATASKNNGTLFYADGIWHSPAQEKAWDSHVAAGTAAAGLWQSGLFDQAPDKKEQLRAWAVETFDRAIKDHRNADGSFGNKELPEGMFFLVELGAACLRMDACLDAGRKAVWHEAVVKGIAQLVETGNLYNDKTKRNWYANGNLELDETTLLYYAFTLTHQEQYRTMFERQLAFTLYPDRPRWRNFGLYYEVEPARPDGLDGRGYLAENNSGRPGYDGDYTHFQSSIAAKLYLASEDPRILRLVNLFLNQMLPHVDRDTWIFDATAGSRHSTMLPLTTPAYAVSAFECNRKKLLVELDEQVSMTLAHYNKAAHEGWLHPGMYRGLNGELFTLLQACMRPAANGKAPAP
jgi:hypothetical protein